MTHLFILQILLVASYVFHQTESWDIRPLALFSVVALFTLVRLPKTQLQFAFISIVALFLYAEKFPNLANHSNLSFFIFLLTIPLTLGQFRPLSGEHYNQFLKTVRWLAFITYFFAAFHKFNSDFFNPEVSCANDKMGEYLALLPNSLSFLKTTLQQLMPALGFLTEAVIPLCLVVPRLRRFGFLFVCGLHFLLAPLGFIDFSSLAMVLAWSFVVPEKINTELALRHVQWLTYAVLALVCGLGLFRWEDQTEDFAAFEGIAFAVIYTPFIYTHMWPNIYRGRLELPKWSFGLAFLFFMFAYGFSNYLGLRTAGTFSMFSNLKTEGTVSNHYLLSSNPFKIFSFQENVVEVIAVDERIEGFYRKMPKVGQLIPRVEFSRILDRLREENRLRAHLEVIYQGVTYKTEKAGYDPTFDFQVPAWQKKLFKFRAIPKEGPQHCAW